MRIHTHTYIHIHIYLILAVDAKKWCHRLDDWKNEPIFCDLIEGVILRFLNEKSFQLFKNCDINTKESEDFQ